MKNRLNLPESLKKDVESDKFSRVGSSIPGGSFNGVDIFLCS